MDSKAINHEYFIDFSDFIAYIDREYDFTPSSFSVYLQNNSKGENEDLLKVIAYGLLYNMGKLEILPYFKEHYKYLLNMPVNYEPTDDIHKNIKEFMIGRWSRIKINGRIVTNVAHPIHVLKKKQLALEN